MAKVYGKAGKLDIVIEQGATFTYTITYTDSAKVPIDLTGFIARMHIRSTLPSSTIKLELTTENGRLTLGGTAGTIDILISADDTAAMQWCNGVYDLEVEEPLSGVVERLIQGKVTVSQEVTR